MTIYKSKDGGLVNLDAVAAVSPAYGKYFTVHIAGGRFAIEADEYERFTESWINEFDAEVVDK